MIDHTTLYETTQRFGRNSYIEFGRHRGTRENGSQEFLLLTRGFFRQDGTKRWARYVTVPDDRAALEWLRDAIVEELRRKGGA